MSPVNYVPVFRQLLSRLQKVLEAKQGGSKPIAFFPCPWPPPHFDFRHPYPFNHHGVPYADLTYEPPLNMNPRWWCEGGPHTYQKGHVPLKISDPAVLATLQGYLPSEMYKICPDYIEFYFHGVSDTVNRPKGPYRFDFCFYSKVQHVALSLGYSDLDHIPWASVSMHKFEQMMEKAVTSVEYEKQKEIINGLMNLSVYEPNRTIVVRTTAEFQILSIDVQYAANFNGVAYQEPSGAIPIEPEPTLPEDPDEEEEDDPPETSEPVIPPVPPQEPPPEPPEGGGISAEPDPQDPPEAP